MRTLIIAVLGISLSIWSAREVAGVGQMIAILIGLFAALAFAYQAVKRLHDLDRPASEFWKLLMVYPLVGLLTKPSMRGSNQYGPEPGQSSS